MHPIYSYLLHPPVGCSRPRKSSAFWWVGTGEVTLVFTPIFLQAPFPLLYPHPTPCNPCPVPLAKWLGIQRPYCWRWINLSTPGAKACTTRQREAPDQRQCLIPTHKSVPWYCRMWSRDVLPIHAKGWFLVLEAPLAPQFTHIIWSHLCLHWALPPTKNHQSWIFLTPQKKRIWFGSSLHCQAPKRPKHKNWKFWQAQPGLWVWEILTLHLTPFLCPPPKRFLLSNPWWVPPMCYHLRMTQHIAMFLIWEIWGCDCIKVDP